MVGEPRKRAHRVLKSTTQCHAADAQRVGALAEKGRLVFHRSSKHHQSWRAFKWPDKQSIADQKTLVQCCFGTQAYSGDWHLTSFTPKLLEHYLGEAGLSVVESSPKDHWLLDVTARKS